MNFKLFISSLFLLSFFISCTVEDEIECVNSFDCLPGFSCIDGVCIDNETTVPDKDNAASYDGTVTDNNTAVTCSTLTCGSNAHCEEYTGTHCTECRSGYHQGGFGYEDECFEDNCEEAQDTFHGWLDCWSWEECRDTFGYAECW